MGSICRGTADWGALLCFGLLPVVVFGAARREKLIAERVGAGLCVHCGYDVRAAPGRCPECEKVCYAVRVP